MLLGMPPTVSSDKDCKGSQTFELELNPLEYASQGAPSQQNYRGHPSAAHDMHHAIKPLMPTSATDCSYTLQYVANYPYIPAVQTLSPELSRLA